MILKALDPRTDEGLPLLATLLGVFSIVCFVFFVYFSLMDVITWEPLTWILSKLPYFLQRTVFFVITTLSATFGLVGALAGVKVLHLLPSLGCKDCCKAPAPGTPEA